jgi:hypothetical protein
MYLDDVVPYLGLPDNLEFRKKKFDKQKLKKIKQPGWKEISIIKYGCLELIYERVNDTLISIQIELHQSSPQKIPTILGTKWLSLIKGMSSANLIIFFQDHQIEWHQENLSSAEALFYRINTSCVAITVDLEDNRDHVYSIIKDTFNRDCSANFVNP